MLKELKDSAVRTGESACRGSNTAKEQEAISSVFRISAFLFGEDNGVLSVACCGESTELSGGCMFEVRYL